VQQTPGSGMVVACTLPSGPGNEDILVLKLRDNGDVAWQKRLGGSGNDRAYFIRQTRDGGYIIGGWTSVQFSGLNYDCLLIKLGSNGETQWQTAYGGTYSDLATSIIQTDDGGYLMAGWTYSFGRGERDIWALKLSGDGALEWQQLYPGAKTDANYAVKQGSDGLYSIECCNLLSDRYEVKTLFLKQDGTCDRQKTYTGSYGVGCGRIEAVFQTKDEGYALAGGMRSPCDGDRNAMIVKQSRDGETGWVRSYGGMADEYAEAVVQTLDGGYLLAGWTYSFGYGDRCIWVVRLDGKGTIPDDKILQTRNTAADDVEVVAVPAVHLGRGVGVKKLTFTADAHDQLHLHVSGPVGYRYVFPAGEIPALRDALRQSVDLLASRTHTVGEQDLAKITHGSHVLTVSVRYGPEGKGDVVLYLRVLPSRMLSDTNPLFIEPEQVVKIINALDPANVKKALTQLQGKKK
jgi:hypothetical protein